MDDLKVKVLFLAGIPRDEDDFRARDEYSDIEQAVRAAPQGDLMKIIYEGNVRRDRLDGLLNEHNPHIVHFSGNGKGEDIYFVNDNGNAAPVGIETLMALLRGYRQNIQVVILNACYTDTQAEAIAQIVGCAIVIDRVITDAAAKIFVTTFYKRIAARYSIQQAYELSLLHLHLVKRNDEARFFKLYHRVDVNPEQINLVRLLYKGHELLSNPNVWNQYVALIETVTSINHAFQTLYILNLHGLNIQLELIGKDSSLLNAEQFFKAWEFYTNKYDEFLIKLGKINMADIAKALRVLQTINSHTIRDASEENQNFPKVIVQLLSNYSNLHDAVRKFSRDGNFTYVLEKNISKEFRDLSIQVFRLSENAKDLILASDSFLQYLVSSLYPTFENLSTLNHKEVELPLPIIEFGGKLDKNLVLRSIGKKTELLSPIIDPGEIVELFYATSRKSCGDPALNLQYGSEYAPLTYGVCKVNIPPGHVRGEIERPRWWKLQFSESNVRDVTLLSIEELDVLNFRSLFSSRLDAKEEKSALLFIHGYNIDFKESAWRAAQIAHDLLFPGVVAFYSWPSAGKVFGYPHDLQMATDCIPHLTEVITIILQMRGITKLHVIAHSLGSYILACALSDLKNSKNKQRESKLIHQIILCAPDIDQLEFDQKIYPNFESLGVRRTIYASGNDEALKTSEGIRGHLPRIGNVGEKLYVRKNIDTVDATNVKTDMLGHGYFAETQALINDIYNIVRNELAPERRNLRRQLSNDNLIYWLFPK